MPSESISAVSPESRLEPSKATASAGPTASSGWSDQALDDPDVLEGSTRWETLSDGRRVARTTLELSGMHCAACAGIIEAVLAPAPGVLAVRVSAAQQRAELTWAPSEIALSALIGRLRQSGYDAVPALRARSEGLRRQERRTLLWRLFVAWFCAMQVMMLATPSYVATPGDITPDLLQLLNWGQWLLSLPVMLFAGRPFMEQAYRALIRRRLSMDVPVALGIIVMFIASSVATFAPNGPLGAEVVFDSLTMFISFLLGARWLEMQVRHRAARELEDLLHQAPRPVWRLSETGQAESVMPSALRAGDRIRVAVGEAFPVDGVLLSGCTSVSESLMTGESLPVVREPGQQVLAGSLNLGVPVELCVTGVGADTRREQLVALAERAALDRPALVQTADRWAGPFLWGVLCLSALGFLAWQWVDPTRALWVAVAVLVVTCPCALSLAAPATLAAAAQGLARDGVLLQRLGAIEDLARVDTVVFDKTGTLTQDRLSLIRITGPADDAERQAALKAAASLASWSHHPASRALVEAADRSQLGAGTQGPSRPAVATAWQAVRELPGLGVQGRDAQGLLWRLGRPAWVSGRGSADEGSATGLYLAWGPAGEPQVWFELADRLRDDAVDALGALAQGGWRSAMLSGDAAPRVQAVARQLDLPVAGAGALPEDKRWAVQRLQAEGRTVAMVGDGVNDVPVLAQAQVSIAMGHGSAVTMARADVIVLSQRLMALPESLWRARRTLALIRQNLGWALAYNLGAIPMALAGWLPPWAAGLGMALSSLLVVANSRRAASARLRS